MSLLIPIAALLTAQTTPTILQFTQPAFRDAVFTARKVRSDQRELLKINNDFGQTYRFDSISIKVKEPFKLRLEADVDDTKVLYLITGATQFIKVPRLGIKRKEDLTMAPGRRQTMLDFGMLTQSLFTDLFQAKFIRFDRATGNPIFDLTFPAKLDDTSRHRIWVDKDRHYVVKREWYNQYGRQLATFLYENPVEQKGVWMPTKLTVRNVDDKVAGITSYDRIKINAGIGEDQFTSG